MEICERQWSTVCGRVIPLYPRPLNYTIRSTPVTLTNTSRTEAGSGLVTVAWRPALCKRASTSGSFSTRRVSSHSCSCRTRPGSTNKCANTGGLSAFSTRQMTDPNQPIIWNACGAAQSTKIVYNFQGNSSCEKTGSSHTCSSLILPVLLPISDYLLSSDST